MYHGIVACIFAINTYICLSGPRSLTFLSKPSLVGKCSDGAKRPSFVPTTATKEVQQPM